MRAPANIKLLLSSALLGAVLVASSAQAASCPRTLAVRVQAPTTNASALQRVGFVRVTAIGSGQRRGLRVVLRRGGRTIAQGSRSQAFTGTVRVRLSFRHKALPGPASLTVSGRRAGCAATRLTRRALSLDGRDLAVSVVAKDQDVGAGTLAVTLVATGRHAVSDLRARLLDAAGSTIAVATRRRPQHGRARLRFALRDPAAGRHWLIVTAGERGLRGRSSGAEPIDLKARSGTAGAVVGPAPSSGPPPGAVVQQVSLGWSAGHWQGNDSAAFTAPGIGDGQIVCRPDTQWIRVFPTDRSRDVAMMLWTFRDWEGGSESTIREAEMTPFTGPDFNEGFNKFQPSEKRSHGTFEGVIADGLPTAGAFGIGRPPTEVRLSWSWDFSDPANASCSVQATFTSQGPGSAGTVARGLSLRWRGESGVPADTTVSEPVPGLGTVQLRCDAGADGLRELVVQPDAVLDGLALTTYEGSVRSDRGLGDTPYVLPLPNNGLVEAATPSGAPLRLVVSSRWKANDPDPAQNFCRVSAIVVAG